MDNVDGIRAYIDEVCREDDRLRAERAWEATRRLKESSMVRKSAPGVIYRDVAPAENRADENALRCTQPVTSPAVSTNEWAGWEQWLRGHLDIEGSRLRTSVGEVLGEMRRNMLDQIEPQLAKIAALELKLAQLTGAVDVLRGKVPPAKATMSPS